jgi:UDP-glucose 4-epimerase
MAVLVTGGAGYIGSHMALALLDRGDDVVVLDNLATGVADQVPSAALFIRGDVRDKALVGQILRDNAIDAVVHFAGSTVVPESVADPLKYYANNTAATRDLLEACTEGGVERFIFSSTAAVYGVTDADLVDEGAEKAPATPYGRSKLMSEAMLADLAAATALNYIALRYFNVAGADPQQRTGQSTPGATHLIKRACQAALGRLPALGVFGTDFPTPDGTGVRDYIHVTDLVAAHMLALDHLRAGGASDTYNCGYGSGFSVLDVCGAVERVSGRAVPLEHLPRRPGDLGKVVADSSKLKAALGWTPRYASLDTIVDHAFRWEQRLPG